MKKVCPCIGIGGCWALAGALGVAAAFTPAATAQCDNPDPTPACDGQIGIQGNFEQGCDGLGGSDNPDTPEAGDGWTGLAFPFQTLGAMVDAVRFTLNTNRAGGDIWEGIVRDSSLQWGITCPPIYPSKTPKRAWTHIGK